jgi:hypothetical protein
MGLSTHPVATSRPPVPRPRGGRRGLRLGPLAVSRPGLPLARIRCQAAWDLRVLLREGLLQGLGRSFTLELAVDGLGAVTGARLKGPKGELGAAAARIRAWRLPWSGGSATLALPVTVTP